MNILSRALISLKGNKGKTTIWLFLFLISSGMVMTTFFTNMLYESMLADIFIDGDVPVYVVPKALNDDSLTGVDYATVNMDMLEEIGNTDTVDSVDKKLQSQVEFGELKHNNSPNSTRESLAVYYIDDVLELDDKEGYTVDYDENIEFKDNSILLSEELLEVNDLSIGDKINLDLNPPSSETPYSELSNVEFEIVGAYTFEATQKQIAQEKEMASKYNFEPDLNFTSMQLDAYMPMTVAEKIIKLDNENNADQESLYYNYMFNLKDIDDLTQFTNDAEAITGFPLDVTVNTSNLPDGKITVNGLNTITLITRSFFVAGLIIVVLSLLIISTLMIRGRRREIGILLALGAKRSTVYLQFVLEQSIVMLIATIFMYIIGCIVTLLLVNNVGFGSSFLFMPLVYSVLCGFFLVIVVTLIPAIYTMKSNPKEILM